MTRDFLVAFVQALGCLAVVIGFWFVGGTLTYWITGESHLAFLVALLVGACAGWGLYRAINRY